MPFVTTQAAINAIKQANIDKLHYLLRPGNEKKLIPGLKRSAFIVKKNNEKMTRKDWDSRDFLTALTNNELEQVGYSTKDYLKTCVKKIRFLQDDNLVEQLKLIAAILTVWPYLEHILDDPSSQSLSYEFINQQLKKFYKERDAYYCEKTKLLACLSSVIDPIYNMYQVNILNSTKPEEKKQFTIGMLSQVEQPINRSFLSMKTIMDEVDKVTYLPLRHQTKLFQSIRLFFEQKKTGTDCMEEVKTVFNHSRTKIVGGIGLELLGVILIAASIAFVLCAFGAFGTICSVNMVGVYFGVHCFMGFVSASTFGAGCYSVKTGFGFFKQGCSDRWFVNQFQTVVGTYSFAVKEESDRMKEENQPAMKEENQPAIDLKRFTSQGSYDEDEEKEKQPDKQPDKEPEVEILDEFSVLCSVQ